MDAEIEINRMPRFPYKVGVGYTIMNARCVHFFDTSLLPSQDSKAEPSSYSPRPIPTPIDNDAENFNPWAAKP